MDTAGHQCEQQGLDKRQCQKQVRMILSFMEELIQDSARKKNCKKSGTESADKKERKIETEK